MLSFALKKRMDMRFSRKMDKQKQQFYTFSGVKLLFFFNSYIFYLTIMLFCFRFLQSLNEIFFSA